MRWKENKEFNCLVSEFGDVKSLKTNKERKSHVTKQGYKRIGFNKNGKLKSVFIHRLVALCFCEGFDNNKQVNHVDGDKLNNHFSNLEWVSASENTKHAYKKGLAKPKDIKGSKNPMNKYTAEIILELRKVVSEGMSRKEASEKFNIPRKYVDNVITRKRWGHI